MSSVESNAVRGERAHRLLLACAAAASLAAAEPARACSVCGCGDPLLVTTDPAAINGQLRLQVDTEYLRVDAGTEGQPGFTDELTQWSYRFNAVYRPLEALSLTATVPLVSKAIRTVGGGANLATSSVTGLGDIEAGGRWALWRNVDLGRGRVQELALSAGTSMPTGEDSVRASDGSRVDEHGQPGTGAWGPFAGIHYRFEEGRWVAFASVSGRTHTANRYHYTYGPALLWSAHAQLQPIRSLALDVGIDGRRAWADRDAGEIVANTGGTVLAIAPGAYLEVAGGAWLFLRGQIPFHERLLGQQDQLPSVVAGVQYQIP